MQNLLERFEKIFYYSNIGIAIFSLEGKWLKVNPALSKITGYTEEELLSTSFCTITHPDDIEENLQHIEALREGKKDSYEIEKRYIHKNGSIVWVLISASAVWENNQPLFIIAHIQDITERKRLEMDLIESEERLRNLIVQIPNPVIIHDGKVILFANAAATKLVGTTFEEVEGHPITKYIDPTNFEVAKKIIDEVLRNKQPYHDLDFRIRDNKGTIIDTVLSAIPTVYSGKKAILVSFRDITERKKVENALKESEKRYRLLIEHLPLGILLYKNSSIQFANSTALRLLGADKLEDLIGLNIYNLIHSDFQPLVTDRNERINRGEFISPEYVKLIRLDGKEIDVEADGIPIEFNGQSAVQIVFWDVTEKKKEEDLVRYRAYHDTLTDLPNRLKFQLDIDEELNNCNEFTLLYLDMHGLKPVNDNYGHQAGDTVLIKVTSRLSGTLDSIGRVYRVGGDEFVVILPGIKSEEELSTLITKTVEVMKQPIYISNSIVQITASIGVVFSPQHGNNLETLLRHADKAMYYAKKTNTNYKIFEQ